MTSQLPTSQLPASGNVPLALDGDKRQAPHGFLHQASELLLCVLAPGRQAVQPLLAAVLELLATQGA